MRLAYKDFLLGRLDELREKCTLGMKLNLKWDNATKRLRHRLKWRSGRVESKENTAVHDLPTDRTLFGMYK
jgi:hypothetical protein